MLTCLYLLWQVHFSNTPDSQIELTDRGYAQAAAPSNPRPSRLALAASP